MKKKPKAFFLYSALIFCTFIYFSCAGQNAFVPYTAEDRENEIKQEKVFVAGKILAAQGGYGADVLPAWLSLYIKGGAKEIEKNDINQNKYYFIGRNESASLNALNKWTNNYSAVQDFSRLVAGRIEERMISAAVLYPDNDYGNFFEAFVKKARSSEYPGVEKIETYWIQTRKDREIPNIDQNETAPPVYSVEVYESFIVFNIEKTALQAVINNMMAEVLSSVSITRAQRSAVGRLQQIFFDGF